MATARATTVAHDAHRTAPPSRSVAPSSRRFRTVDASVIPVLLGQSDAHVLYSSAVIRPRPERAFGRVAEQTVDERGANFDRDEVCRCGRRIDRLGSSLNVEAADELDDGPY
jgi:hypothetical protein